MKKHKLLVMGISDKENNGLCDFIESKEIVNKLRKIINDNPYKNSPAESWYLNTEIIKLIGEIENELD